MTDPTTAVIVEALRSQADQRLRAGLRLAVELETDRAAGKDVRSRAVRLVTWLSGAQALRDHADRLEAGPMTAQGLGIIATPTTPAQVDAVAAVVAVATVEDDGTSPEAQRVAALAGLTATELVEDPETGATAEDEVDLVPADPALADVGKP